MKIRSSKTLNTESKDFPNNFEAEINETLLQDLVEKVSIPRHYVAESLNNLEVRFFIIEKLKEYGWNVEVQGEFKNIIATLPPRYYPLDSPIIVGATHYDSVPGCPGADDNGSGVAVLLAAAKTLTKRRIKKSPMLLFFNREEDGLLGSREFVKEREEFLLKNVKEVHVMEMVGYTSDKQSSPEEIPLNIGNVGDFLGIVSNYHSQKSLDNVIYNNSVYINDFESKGLYLPKDAEKIFIDVIRSDHYPFWQSDIPALMWTDTSEFRNPHYHLSTDTADTLDYNFMLNVTRLFLSLYL